MLKPDPELARLDRRFARASLSMSYHEALEIFTALWMEARALDPEFPARWRNDIATDVAVARALNGPPREA